MHSKCYWCNKELMDNPFLPVCECNLESLSDLNDLENFIEKNKEQIVRFVGTQSSFIRSRQVTGAFCYLIERIKNLEEVVENLERKLDYTINFID